MHKGIKQSVERIVSGVQVALQGCLGLDETSWSIIS